MRRYFFTLGVVPVQAWIAEARRSRDLKAGSVFLWHLMAELLAELEKRPGAQVLLPRLDSGTFARLAGLSFAEALEEPYGVPNRAGGELQAADDEEVRQTFEGLEERLRERWQSFKQQALTSPPHLREAWSLLQEPVRRYLAATAGGEDCPLSLAWIPTLEIGHRRQGHAGRGAPER